MNPAFVDALVALSRSSVDFVVGVYGINFFARDPSAAFMTLDLDVLLRPEPANLHAAFTEMSVRWNGVV